jgi:hypothetical protein
MGVLIGASAAAWCLVEKIYVDRWETEVRERDLSDVGT